MIKMCLERNDGTPMLLLGLSRSNTEKLLEGKPIFIDTEELNEHPDVNFPRIGIAILAGETEVDILDEVKANLNVDIEFATEPPPGFGLPPEIAAAKDVTKDVLNKLNDILGSTGKFPNGKLNENDEGELAAAISVVKGENGIKKVVINFGDKKINWLALMPEQAEAFAGGLIAYAKIAKEQDEEDSDTGSSWEPLLS